MGKADLTLSLWDRLVLLGGVDGSLGMQGTKPPPFGDVQPADGSGLSGLTDRVAAVGGKLILSSPPGGPTLIRVEK